MKIEPNTPDEMVEITTALRDGKQLEAAYVGVTDTGNDCWSKMPGTCLNFAYQRYRIAREPQRVWINIYPASVFAPAAYPDRASADRNAGTHRINCLEFVEVQK